MHIVKSLTDSDFHALIRQLLPPVKGIHNPEQQRQARLLSILSLLFTPIVPVISFYIWQKSNYNVFNFLLIVIVTIGFALIYCVSRTRHFQLAGFAMVSIITMSTTLSIIVEVIYAVPLTYISFSSLIAIVILSTRNAVISSIFNIIIGVGISLYMPSAEVEGNLVFLFILTVAVWIIALLRRYDLQELETKNEMILTLKQQQLESELEHKKARLLASFIQDVSHDIKTPLSIIKTSVYILKKRLSQENHDRLDKIDNQVAFLTKIVDDLLLMSRLDSPAQLDMTMVNINSLLRQVCTELTSVMEDHLQSIHIDLVEDFPEICGDITELHRGLTNLIHNALIYTSDGGYISIKSKYQEGLVRIEIQDTGTGIPEADLPHIFDRFYRVDKARTFSNNNGSGLGLAITKRIIELHDGEISVMSNLGKGTTFIIQLPGL